MRGICLPLEAGPTPDPATCGDEDSILVVFGNDLVHRPEVFWLSPETRHSMACWYSHRGRLQDIATLPIVGWCWVLREERNGETCGQEDQ